MAGGHLHEHRAHTLSTFLLFSYTGISVKIPLRLRDWRKIKKTGRGYSRREITVVKILQGFTGKEQLGSFLNIGFHDYQDIRTQWWIDICRANNIDWHILEVFEPNVHNFLKHAPEADHHRIHLGNLQDISDIFEGTFDVVLHWHGPEHLDKDIYLQLLPEIISKTKKLLILGCPNGHEDQGQAYGNPYEEHLSFWTGEDFHQLGFRTIEVSDKKPGHITAYKVVQEMEPGGVSE